MAARLVKQARGQASVQPAAQAKARDTPTAQSPARDTPSAQAPARDAPTTEAPAAEASASEAHARCMCGRVHLVARFPSRFCAHCHCESCRRAHAAGFVTWVGFRDGQVSVTEGADLIRTYESSPGTRRTFCGHCGTRLTFESVKWPGETHLPLACFDTPVDRQPSGNAFVDEHAPWIVPTPVSHA